MKKILSILVLSILVIALVAPLAANGQGTEKIKECCKVSQAINLKDGPVATPNGNQCPIPASGKVAISAPNATAALDCAAADVTVRCGNANWGMYCLVNVVYVVTNWIFYLMMIGVVIVFVIAGARFMMTSGDPEKTKNAKGMMILGIVGLVIALVAKLIPSVIKLIVGM